MSASRCADSKENSNGRPTLESNIGSRLSRVLTDPFAVSSTIFGGTNWTDEFRLAQRSLSVEVRFRTS